MGETMPQYEYYCASCDADFEVRRGIKDETAQRCLKCGGYGAVTKLVSLPGKPIIN